MKKSKKCMMAIKWQINKSTEELIAVVKEVAEAIDCPLVVEGCKNVEKDAELLPKVAEALQGRNVIVMSEKEGIEV